MKKYFKISNLQVPKEDPRGGSFYESPQLKMMEKSASERVDDISRGSLAANATYDWHMHRGVDEVCIVVKGTGKFYCGQEETIYNEGDVLVIPADSMHKFVSQGPTASEFYFVRVKV